MLWNLFKPLLIILNRIHTLLLFFHHKGLTRNPETRNTLVWIFPNIWKLGQVRNTKFGTNVSNEILRNAPKCQSYSFYRFWEIKGKPTGGKTTPLVLPPPSFITERVKSKDLLYLFVLFTIFTVVKTLAKFETTLKMLNSSLLWSCVWVFFEHLRIFREFLWCLWTWTCVKLSLIIPEFSAVIFLSC